MCILITTSRSEFESQGLTFQFVLLPSCWATDLIFSLLNAYCTKKSKVNVVNFEIQIFLSLKGSKAESNVFLSYYYYCICFLCGKKLVIQQIFFQGFIFFRITGSHLLTPTASFKPSSQWRFHIFTYSGPAIILKSALLTCRKKGCCRQVYCAAIKRTFILRGLDWVLILFWRTRLSFLYRTLVFILFFFAFEFVCEHGDAGQNWVKQLGHW